MSALPKNSPQVGNISRPAACECPPLSPEVSPGWPALIRLGQLAADIERALSLRNPKLLAQATSLLAPALEECHQTFDGETSGLTEELAAIQRSFHASEAQMTLSMAQASSELRRLRQGKHRLATLQSSIPAAYVSHQLDALR